MIPMYNIMVQPSWGNLLKAPSVLKFLHNVDSHCWYFDCFYLEMGVVHLVANMNNQTWNAGCLRSILFILPSSFQTWNAIHFIVQSVCLFSYSLNMIGTN